MNAKFAFRAGFMRVLEPEEIEQHLKELRVYGYAVIKKFMDQATVDRALAIINGLFDPERFILYKGRPDKELEDRFVYNLQNKDKFFVDILDDLSLTKILMEMLNDPFYKHLPPDVPNYILGYYNARSSGSKLELHTDTFVPSPGEKTWTMQVAFILEDADLSNGCTILVPGSHISGKFVDRKLAKIEPVPARAGDVVMWDSRTWHGANANVTNKSRWATLATFTTWWVKQRSDMTRSLPEEIYQQLSDRQKALLGFCSIPPKDENERLNFKGGYENLLPSVKDYYR